MDTTSPNRQNRPVDLIAFRQARALKRQASGRCCNYSVYAFTLPWLSVTAVTLISHGLQNGCTALPELLLPGLLAGGTGAFLYKFTKQAVKWVRGVSRQSIAH